MMLKNSRHAEQTLLVFPMEYGAIPFSVSRKYSGSIKFAWLAHCSTKTSSYVIPRTPIIFIHRSFIFSSMDPISRNSGGQWCLNPCFSASFLLVSLSGRCFGLNFTFSMMVSGGRSRPNSVRGFSQIKRYCPANFDAPYQDNWRRQRSNFDQAVGGTYP